MTNLTNKLFLPVFMLLLSISPAAAHNDTFFNSPHRLELKPASFAEPGYLLAKSYWLGGADLDLNFKDEDDKTRCNSMGYFQEACQGNKSPLLKCPYNSAYVKCTCDTSIYRYSALNCPPGSYPDEDVCDDYSKGCVCENNKIWSAEDNSCVGCLSDSDCADGKECNNRECVNIDLCAGVNCTGGQSCNSETGACECPSGEVFYNNRCEAPSCTNKEIQCSGSTPVCAANGQCVECVSASDCGANEICSGNTCQTVDRCKDVSCSGGKSCNPNNGQCECPSDKPYESGGVCEAPNCVNGGLSCPSGQTCNKTSKVCEAAETCRTQAEAKGYKLIENENDFMTAAAANATKFAVSGNVTVSETTPAISLKDATITDAVTAVGGLCTTVGKITAGNIAMSGSLTIDNIDTEIAELTSSADGTLKFNPGRSNKIYVQSLKILKGTLNLTAVDYNSSVYESDIGRNLYPNNIDTVEISSNAGLVLGGYIAVGGVGMTCYNTSSIVPGTTFIVQPGSYIISHFYKDYSDSFIETSSGRCTIHIGQQSYGAAAVINANRRSLSTGGITIINIMSSILKNTKNIASQASLHFDARGGSISQIQFLDRTFIGTVPAYGGSGNHFQCQYNLNGAINSGIQCADYKGQPSGQCGNCTGGNVSR